MGEQPEFDWRTMGALHAVSAMAQVGQFGMAFVMLPVWLAEQGFVVKLGVVIALVGLLIGLA